MAYHWYDFVGNIGIVFILTSYLLLQLERVSASDWGYSAANGVGAALILLSLCFAFNLSAFLIEAAWLLISLFGLFKTIKARR